MKILRRMVNWLENNILILVIIVIAIFMIGLYLDIRSTDLTKDKQIQALIQESKKKDEFDNQYRNDTNSRIAALTQIANEEHTAIQTLILQLQSAKITPDVDQDGKPVPQPQSSKPPIPSLAPTPTTTTPKPTQPAHPAPSPTQPPTPSPAPSPAPNPQPAPSPSPSPSPAPNPIPLPPIICILTQC